MFKKRFKKRIYKACSVVSLLVLCQLALAQRSPLSFTSISSKDGLSSNVVKSILKDKYGLMWFGTEDGLNKFDGISFTIYRHDFADSTSLQANEITSLYEDKTGKLWVGTNGGSLSYYNRRKDNFVNFKYHPEANKLNSSIRAITGDSSGQIWVAHFGGLSMINPVTGKILSFEINASKPGMLSTKVVLSVFEDSLRRIWVGTADGLFLYLKDKKAFTHYKSSADETSLVGDNVRCIGEDKQGNLYIGTSEGLSRLLPDGKSFKNFGSGFSSRDIYAMACDADGKLWLGTENGLNIFDTRTTSVVSYLPDKRNRQSISAKSIRSILIDKNGIYWLGSYQGGISKYDKNLSLFHLKQSNPFDPFGLSASIVRSFAEGTNPDDVYVGTDGGGLNLFHRSTGLLEHIDLPDERSGSFSILALSRSKNKELWVGTYANGLFVLDPGTSKARHFKKGKLPGDLNSNDIFCITEDSKGDVWIGTNGEGVNVFNRRTGVFTKYSKKKISGSDLLLPLNGYIRSIVEDQDGNMWIGSHGSGIAMLDRRSGTFKVYNRLNSQLSSNIVYSLFNDSDNNIWVGTADGGLNRLNRKTGKFTALTEKDGLANNAVYKIIEDQKGKLWLSTNNSISSFDRKSRRLANYTYHNGVQNNNFSLGAGLLLSNGEIYFGGLEGFNYFKPSELKRNTHIPPVIFTDLKVANRSIGTTDSAILSEHISVAKEIHLDYKQNFSISFVALNFTSPRKNTYSFKLDGFDKEWTEPSSARFASYTNIDPGEYTFQVMASNNDGVWNRTPISIRVIVRPPFWRTIYAYIFYVLLFIGILLYARYQTLRKLKREFVSEQERIKTSLAIAEERREAQRIRELDSLKIKFLTNLSHEFRTPISLIMGPVDNLLQSETDDRRSGQLSMIKRNGRRLLNLVNQLLDFRKMEEHELRLNARDGEVIEFIKEVADSFKDLAERKRIHFITKSDIQALSTRFDHDKLERILFNLLSNAFKFTPSGGTVSLELTENQIQNQSPNISQNNPDTTWLCIKVEDSGIGISQEQKDKVFERFFQDHTNTTVLNQGSGIGLSITREFIKLHGGTIEVESEEGKGAAFIVNIPFERASAPSIKDEDPLSPVNDADENNEILQDIDHRINDETILSDESAGPEDSSTEIPSILLVEDNDDFRFYLKDNLKAYYRVFEATNGKEGWQKALSCHPQLIVSDVNMPVMDGVEFCKKVKADKRTKHIPIILLTALTAEEEQIKGLQTGANDYMSKPFNFEILNAKIKNLLVLNLNLKTTYTRQFKVITQEIELESEDKKLMTKVQQYIEENINDPKLSVEDLSRQVGMSRSTLYNKIMELTGQSPVEFIRNVKLDRAAFLLEKSDMNVAQISYQAGFATPNYFAKMFKARFNMLPSEYVSAKRK